MKTIREHKFITAGIVLALLITAVTLTSLLRTDEADRKKRAESIEEAVRERVIQCYVIENAYPESLSYLEEYYGLTVNKKEYKIIYTPFAENIPPDIRVICKEDVQ